MTSPFPATRTASPASQHPRGVETTLHAGGQTLHVRSTHTPGVPKAKIAILHGYGDHAGRYTDVQLALGLAGYESHAMDFRGHGISTGGRGAVGRWDDYLRDLAQFLAAPLWTPPGDTTPYPRFILAHSHGGLVAAAAALRGRLSGIAGLVLSSPFFNPGFPIPLHKRALASVGNLLLPNLRISSGLRGTPMCSDPDLQADTANDPLINRTATPRWFVGMRRAQAEVGGNAADIKLPTLTLLGTADRVADIAAIRSVHAALGSPDKRLIEYDGFLHELLREKDRARVFADIVAWLDARVG
jgi:alpha-beta hydrolase superfamily lysophospholipase